MCKQIIGWPVQSSHLKSARVKIAAKAIIVVHEFLGHHMIHQEIIQLAEAVSKNKKLLWYLIRATFKVVVKGGVPTSSLHLVLQKKYLRYLDSTIQEVVHKLRGKKR